MALLQRRESVGLLRIAHVHHHQRPASDSEAELVQSLGDQLQLPVKVLHLDLSSGATPAALRDARHAALANEAIACNADAVVMAHHADDQLETILLALTRGAGPRGLGGMAEMRALRDGVLLARPLLQTTREALTDLCGQLELPYCDDPGNENPDTLRGRLRRDVMGVLESLRPGVAARAAAMAPVQAAAAGAFTALLPVALDGAWDRGRLGQLPHAIRLAALHAESSRRVPVDALSAAALSGAADAIGDAREHCRTFQLGGGLELVVDAAVVQLQGV
jgi:tRNA(Ile)-lysidine synthase